MIEKVGHVRNPLTIIAIFAALAEVGGTIVLPLLDPITQHTYVWFLMLFPMILVCVFFFVLYYKHHVLYAPSDFKDDTSFLDLLESQPANLRLESFAKETVEVAAKSQAESGDEVSALEIMRRDRHGKYLLAEELAIAKIAKQKALNVRRSVSERGHRDGGFDGAAESEKHDYIIEVGYAHGSSPVPMMWREKLNRMTEFFSRLPESRKARFRLIIANVYEKEIEPTAELMLKQLQGIAASVPFPVEIMQYCFDQLADEFHLK